DCRRTCCDDRPRAERLAAPPRDRMPLADTSVVIEPTKVRRTKKVNSTWGTLTERINVISNSLNKLCKANEQRRKTARYYVFWICTPEGDVCCSSLLTFETDKASEFPQNLCRR